MRLLARCLAAFSVMLVALPLVGTAQAPQGLMGTWKVNVAKSTYSPGPGPKSQTSVWATAPGGGWTNTVDGVDAAGKPTHTEQVMMFDGKPVELKGAPVPTTLYVLAHRRSHLSVRRPRERQGHDHHAGHNRGRR